MRNKSYFVLTYFFYFVLHISRLYFECEKPFFTISYSKVDLFMFEPMHMARVKVKAHRCVRISGIFNYYFVFGKDKIRYGFRILKCSSICQTIS